MKMFLDSPSYSSAFVYFIPRVVKNVRVAKAENLANTRRVASRERLVSIKRAANTRELGVRNIDAVGGDKSFSSHGLSKIPWFVRVESLHDS
jgi:carotenoid cleavage dioxygenase-like enzyme